MGQNSMISGRHVFGCKTILSKFICSLNTLEEYPFSRAMDWLTKAGPFLRKSLVRPY
jgi:hypothetical protein